MFSVSDFSELEQTSSAKFAVWCAGVERTGRISNSSHGDTAAGALPGGFRAGQSGADDANGLVHEETRVSICEVLYEPEVRRIDGTTFLR